MLNHFANIIVISVISVEPRAIVDDETSEVIQPEYATDLHFNRIVQNVYAHTQHNKPLSSVLAERDTFFSQHVGVTTRKSTHGVYRPMRDVSMARTVKKGIPVKLQRRRPTATELEALGVIHRQFGVYFSFGLRASTTTLQASVTQS